MGARRTGEDGDGAEASEPTDGDEGSGKGPGRAPDRLRESSAIRPPHPAEKKRSATSARRPRNGEASAREKRVAARLERDGSNLVGCIRIHRPLGGSCCYVRCSTPMPRHAPADLADEIRAAPGPWSLNDA